MLKLKFNVYYGNVNANVSVNITKVTIPSTGQYMSSTLQNSLTTQPTTSTNDWTKITQDDGVTTISIQDTMTAAIKQLNANPMTVASSGNRIYQEALKDIFDGINNNEAIFI